MECTPPVTGTRAGKCPKFTILRGMSRVLSSTNSAPSRINRPLLNDLLALLLLFNDPYTNTCGIAALLLHGAVDDVNIKLCGAGAKHTRGGVGLKYYRPISCPPYIHPRKIQIKSL